MPVLVGGVALSAALILVAVTYFRDRSAGRGAARPGDPEAVHQAAQEREIEAARQKYRRELLYCESLRRFEGSDTPCLGDFAFEYKDPFFCDEIPTTIRWQCFQRLARATGRSELCDAVPNPSMKWDCYFDTAAATANTRSCDRILDAEARRRECERAGGGDACRELNAENARQNYKACVAIAQRNPSACQAVPFKPARLGCFRRLAVLKKDFGLCENLRDPQLGDLYQHLLFQCWKDVAVANARIDDCDRIPHGGVRVTTLGKNTWSDCRRLVDSRWMKASCQEEGSDLTCPGKIAAARNDLKMCQTGGSSSTKDICAITFALRRRDGSACASISEEGLRTACLEITGQSASAASSASEASEKR